MNLTRVPEAEWLCVLGQLPVWTVPDAPLLVVSPHPDDETLGCGGLIAIQRKRGIEVKVAAVTDGERAYPGDEGGSQLAAVRREEQSEALERLGVDRSQIIRFGLTDSGVTGLESELVARLMEVATEDALIVAPWEGDYHPDHEACGRAAANVARRTGARLVSYFFWTWHNATPELLSDLPLVQLPLPAEMLRAKTEALARHRSQLQRAVGGPVLPPELLGPAHRKFEVFWPR